MIRYARLRPGRGFRLRRAIAYYAQRVVTVRGVRRGVWRCLAAAVRLRQGASPPGPAEPRVAHAVAALERDGLARLADLVPPAEVATILAYFQDRKVIGPDGCAVVLSELPPGTAMAAYPLATVVRCPGLTEAVNAPENPGGCLALSRLQADHFESRRPLVVSARGWRGNDAVLPPRSRRLALPEAVRLPDGCGRRGRPARLCGRFPPDRGGAAGAALCAADGGTPVRHGEPMDNDRTARHHVHGRRPWHSPRCAAPPQAASHPASAVFDPADLRFRIRAGCASGRAWARRLCEPSSGSPTCLPAGLPFAPASGDAQRKVVIARS